MSSPTSDHAQNILTLTAWLRGQGDLTSARLGILLRDRGVNPKTAVCAKIVPDTKFPQSGVVITPNQEIYQFGFNPALVRSHMIVFDEWFNLTARYMEHEWRDEILAGLAICSANSKSQINPPK